MQPSELQVKLNSLKKNVWTGVQNEDKGPLSWGVSSFAMNSYFTDSESLLRSCSKKLEILESEYNKPKEEKKKKKSKTKKISMKVPNSDNVLESKPPKFDKKKGKLKDAKSEILNHMNSTSFTDIPRNTQQQTQRTGDIKPIKTFRKSAFVATAIQNQKNSKTNCLPISDNSDSDEFIQVRKKIKKRTKNNRNKLQKAATELKLKN